MSSIANTGNPTPRVAMHVKERKIFPSFLIKVDEVHRVGERVLLNALQHTRQEGECAAAFGHKKKKPFMEKALLIMI